MTASDGFSSPEAAAVLAILRRHVPGMAYSNAPPDVLRASPPPAGLRALFAVAPSPPCGERLVPRTNLASGIP
jgi:hypothetical protein